MDSLNTQSKSCPATYDDVYVADLVARWSERYGIDRPPTGGAERGTYQVLIVFNGEHEGEEMKRHLSMMEDVNTYRQLQGYDYYWCSKEQKEQRDSCYKRFNHMFPIHRKSEHPNVFGINRRMALNYDDVYDRQEHHPNPNATPL